MNSDLAIHGGTQAVRREGPHFSWPLIDAGVKDACLAQLKEGVSIYNRSGVIERLEDALRDYFGVRHAVLMNSGTSALHSSYVAAGIGLGDEVIVPAYTFFATATPLLHLGAVPVLADGDENGNIDPADVAARITPRTVAIVATHMWGRPADLPKLRSLADAHGLLLLEDGSHAHGAAVGPRKVGSWGTASGFSMNGPKPLSAGEGGFVLTDDDDIYYRVLMHGHYNKRCRQEIPADHYLHEYAVTGQGLKARIHPVAAAIALNQLGRLDEVLDARARVAEQLREGLCDLPGLHIAEPDPKLRSSWYGLIIQFVPDELDGIAIEDVHSALLAEGCIEVDRPGSTCPLNLLPLFQRPGPLFPALRDHLSYRPGDFPVAELVWSRTLKLPVWHREEDLELVDQYIEGFRKVTTHAHTLGKVSA